MEFVNFLKLHWYEKFWWGYLIYLDLTDGILMLEFVFFKFITNSDMLENGSSVCLTVSQY